MNYLRALEVLDIDRNEAISVELIRKKYKKKALQYHPDKNSGQETCDEFCEVFDAYEFLINYENDDEIFSVFNFKDNIIYELIQLFNKYNIESYCHKYIDKYVAKIKNDKLLKIRKILQLLKLDDSSSIIKYLNTKIEEKMGNIQHMEIHPKLSDLIEDNVYMLDYEDKKYCIPLWHHELVYEHNNNDLHIYCIPTLPSNMQIDENNNIHIHLRVPLKEVIYADNFYIGFKDLCVIVKELFITRYQKICFKNKGISRINHVKIFDVNKKSDVYVHLSLDY